MSAGHIGVDESGKGDYFGPLVIAACYVGPEHLAELEGVKDSKKLTDLLALRYSAVIMRTCPYAIVTVGPAKYNELYVKIPNLNKLLAWGHAKAIEEILTKVDADHVISDQFANPIGLQNALKSKGISIRLESRVRAESDIAVAAASVLARAEFLRRLKGLSEQWQLDLPKGAGSNVDQAARHFIAVKGRENLGSVAKLHFKTTQKL